MLFPIVFGVLLIGGLMIYAATRKPDLDARPNRTEIIRADVDANDVIDRIARAASLWGMSVGARDDARKKLVLSQGTTGFSWGMFYPIRVEARDGRTEIVVGVKPKVPQFPMIPEAKLRKLAGNIRGILGT